MLRTWAFLVVCLIPVAAAAAPIDDAKVAFAAGKTAFERGDYETALQQFQRAQSIQPAPSLLYNLGKTYEALARYREAADAFDKYLEMYGPPQSDEDRQFQENLRARSAADRSRPDRSPPPPGYPPQGYPPQPAYPPNQPPGYYNPYPYPYSPPPVTTGYRISRDDLILEAQRRHRRAIGLIITGVILDVIGIVFLIDAIVDDHSTVDTFGGGRTYVINGVEGFFGASFIVVGIPLWATGIRSFYRSARDLAIYQQQAAPQPGLAPRAAIFNLPVIHF